MPSTSAAQKPQYACEIACEIEFTPAFYRPYEAAAHSALLLISRARMQLQAAAGEDCIRAVTFRLKTPVSIRGKLKKKGLPPSAHAAGAALNDVCGLRVVLTSVAAVYRFADLIRTAGAGECFAVHDYIASPKESGYRSLHLLLRVPVTMHGESLMVPAEIQLRTAAMDLWATIEHGVCYKPIR